MVLMEVLLLEVLLVAFL